MGLIGIKYVPQDLLLGVDPTGRFLATNGGTGTPFLGWGAANWLIHIQIAPVSGSSYPNTAGSTLLAGQIAWLSNMQAKGVNMVTIQLICRYQSTAPNDSASRAPFTTPDDIRTPNNAYFDAVKTFITLAATYGIVVGIALAWAGYDPDQGWANELLARTTGECGTYATYVANRFKDHDNIFWIFGGDRPTGGMSQNLIDRYNAMATAVKAADPDHFGTTHWNFRAGDTDLITDGNDVTSCYFWSGALVANQVEDEYIEGDSAVGMLEARYEENDVTEFELRAQTIRSVLNGALAFVFFSTEGTWSAGGGNPVSQPHLPSQSVNKPYWLDSPGYTHFKHCKKAFDGYPFHKLVPDFSSALVTAGRGSTDTNSYAAAARASDGSYAVISLPTSGTSVTVARSQMSGTFSATWLDPTNGSTSAVSGSPFTNTGTLTLATSAKGTNSAGDDDWIVILRLT